MYEFVDITERGTQSTSLSIQTVFNKFNLDELLTDESGSFTTLTVSGRSNLSNRVNTIEVSGLDGLLESDNSTLSEREITIKYQITDKTNEGFRQRYNRLNALLNGTKKELAFSDEDAIFYGSLSESDVPEEDSNSLIGTITFLCTDPYKYGPEQTIPFPIEAVSITNSGTAEANPIFELEVLAPITFAMVSNGTDYMMIGHPVTVDEEVVDTRTLLLEERGATLSAWSSTPTSVDGGVVAGNLDTDGGGITVPSYGTDTPNWHGPALLKEVVPAQDFEVEMHLAGRTLDAENTFRIEFYLFDEGMNEIGKMAILDNTPNIITKAAEGRVGDYTGPNENYVISSSNYSYKQDFWFGMVRMRRIGQDFEFYVTRIDNSTDHVQSLKKTFKDVANVYQGRLKYVQIHIGKYGTTPRAYAPKIHSITAHELTQVNVDQTPYIADVGDIITFDHTTDEILINGEDRTDLKDFGAEYFKLGAGQNDLVVSPDSFNATIKYRERYK